MLGENAVMFVEFQSLTAQVPPTHRPHRSRVSSVDLMQLYKSSLTSASSGNRSNSRVTICTQRKRTAFSADSQCDRKYLGVSNGEQHGWTAEMMIYENTVCWSW